MVKVIIFDLDDTLYNERTYVFAAFKNVANYISEKYGLDSEEIYKRIIKIFYEFGRGKIFNLICEEYKLDENIKDLVEIYRNTYPEGIELYEDAKEFIKNAKAKGYKLGIITDGMSKVQWNKIKALELEKCIDKIVVSDDLGRENWKPSIVPYKEILNYFEFEPKEAVYIGDNPNKDFIGARNLGLQTVRIIREEGDHMKTILGEEYEADRKINLLSEYEGQYV
ncbi:MAG: HAD family hydrolase [Sarcina sp.]